MKISLSITVMGKGREFFWGKAESEYALIELSGTVLTGGSFYLGV